MEALDIECLHGSTEHYEKKDGILVSTRKILYDL
jgi:hypothetical protein